MKAMKKYFITGMLVIAPVFLTIYVLVMVFRFADNILGRFINDYVQQLLGFYIPGIGFLLSILIIFLVGFFASIFIGREVVPFVEKWFVSLPLVKNIYPAFKQLVSFFLAQKQFGFKKVVLVEYPSKGIWALAFLTNEECPCINKELNREMLAVFIPNTPGPFSGFVTFYPKEEVKFVDISITDALRIIISGGVFKTEG